MDKKIMTLLMILVFAVACLGFVSADNNTTDDTQTVEIEKNLTDSNENLTDLNNYIIPVQITGNGIEFSDGFTGFCIDSSKDVISVDDKFTSQGTKNEETQNNVKLAIIQCYKAGKENDIQNVVSQVLNGNKNYDAAESELNSSQSLDDTAVVKINNTTEATFTFELLKPVDDGKSDCLAYKVSLNTVAGDEVLAAGNDDVNDTAKNATENNTTVENTTVNNNTIENKTVNNKTTENVNVSDANQTPTNQTVINNNTIINNTNNTTNNVNNTTIIQKNTKVANKTNEPPKNVPLQQKIMRAVGNPITILVIVIVVIAIAAVIIRRKD